MNAKVISLAAAVFALVACSTRASGEFVRGVATECPSVDSGAARLLPDEASSHGQRYQTLSSAEAKVASQLAGEIFSGDDAAVPMINAELLDAPVQSGQQFRRHFHGPTSRLRRAVGACRWGNPESLGKKGATTFAMIDATCPSAAQPWDKLKLGIEITAGKADGFCLNAGAPAMIRLGSGTHSGSADRS